MKPAHIVGLALAALLCVGAGAHARQLRVGIANDAASMDAMANWESGTLSVVMNVYEPLLDYEPETGWRGILAERWQVVEPTRWRFFLRRGVRFHDGSEFNADDVVFSIERALSGPSKAKPTVRGIRQAVKVDSHTVDILIEQPNPFVIGGMPSLPIMSKRWAEKNGAVLPADYAKNEANFAVTNANGTGPFMLKSREASVRTVLVENPNWWNQASKQHNLTEVSLLPIRTDATRVAALLSGEVDFISPAPPQDIDRLGKSPGLRTAIGREARGVFLGFNQHSEELPYSNLKGRNPFKDVRVRKAVYHAIDNDTVTRVVMRGMADAANMIIPPGVESYDKRFPRLPFNPDLAKKLLAEAGYADGFEVTLDCSTSRDIGDQETCQALVGMLARVGIRVKLNAQPGAKFLGKLLQRDTAFYRFSWGFNGWAGVNTLRDLLQCKPAGKHGYDAAGYCNPELDALIAPLVTEIDPARRKALYEKAWAIVERDVPYVPLHYPPVLFAMKNNVTALKLRVEGRVWLRDIQVQ